MLENMLIGLFLWIRTQIIDYGIEAVVQWTLQYTTVGVILFFLGRYLMTKANQVFSYLDSLEADALEEIGNVVRKIPNALLTVLMIAIPWMVFAGNKALIYIVRRTVVLLFYVIAWLHRKIPVIGDITIKTAMLFNLFLCFRTEFIDYSSYTLLRSAISLFFLGHFCVTLIVVVVCMSMNCLRSVIISVTNSCFYAVRRTVVVVFYRNAWIQGKIPFIKDVIVHTSRSVESRVTPFVFWRRPRSALDDLGNKLIITEDERKFLIDSHHRLGTMPPRMIRYVKINCDPYGQNDLAHKPLNVDLTYLRNSKGDTMTVFLNESFVIDNGNLSQEFVRNKKIANCRNYRGV
jgi:hypothetical protein